MNSTISTFCDVEVDKTLSKTTFFRCNASTLNMRAKFYLFACFIRELWGNICYKMIENRIKLEISLLIAVFLGFKDVLLKF